MVTLGLAAASLAFLCSYRHLCLGLLRYPVGDRAVSWRKEVWPFQWKIAVSWIGAYCTSQILTPVLFAYRGAVAAGQFGLSVSITGCLWSVVIAWMSTKASPFGQLIARGEFQQLKALFFRTLRKSLAVLAMMAIGCEIGFIGVEKLLPRLAARLVSPQILALLLLTSVSVFSVQSMGICLRAFKREPFLVQSTVIAVLTLLFALSTVKVWAAGGVALSYLLCTGVISLTSAIMIFRRWSATAGCPSDDEINVRTQRAPRARPNTASRC